MRIEPFSPRFKLIFAAIAAVLAVACQADNGTATAPAAAGVAGPVIQADAPTSSTPAASMPVVGAGAKGSPSRPESAAVLPDVLVHKSASCGCCGAWVDHLRAAGFGVRINETEAINPIKERLGVPYGKGSCHTAEVGGYVVEGHVPAADIKRLLAEHPEAKGLVLPGMPIGSPGMEVPDGTVQPYTVELVAPDGRTRPYARHGG